MLKPVDAFLNRTTMYRVTLYVLLGLWVVALGLSAAGQLPFGPVALAASLALILAVCVLVNALFAWAFKVPANAESTYITALILALIIDPPAPSGYAAFFEFAGWAAVLAMASKFLVAIDRKHLFNPAALAVAVTAIAIDQTASWWIGTTVMAVPVTLGGLLLVRKLQRFDLVLTFLGVTIAISLWAGFDAGVDPATVLARTLLQSPALFVAAIMLTEPLTAPQALRMRMAYGALVGVLISPAVHIGALYFTPELALLIGNLVAYFVSPRVRAVLTFKERIEIGADTWELVFQPDRKLAFAPGQYLEWTLGHRRPDSRGNRRYFTIASSPTESVVRLGVKFGPKLSSYKQALLALKPGDTIIVAQVAGEFVLPKEHAKKLVFIAGGIGVTPFRSMLKYLLDRNEQRAITMLYSNNTVGEIAYRDLLRRAEAELGVKTVYTLTLPDRVPEAWLGKTGFIDERMIREAVPDFRDRVFYISGPPAMVDASVEALHKLAVPRANIRTDFFPGFA